MEEQLVGLLAVVLIAGEVVCDVFFGLLGDLTIWLIERSMRARGKEFKPRISAILLIGGAAGGLLGTISIAVFERTLIPLGWLRIANLLFAPLASALIVYRVAQRRKQPDQSLSAREHALLALVITLAFVTVRFVHAVRPG